MLIDELEHHWLEGEYNNEWCDKGQEDGHDDWDWGEPKLFVISACYHYCLEAVVEERGGIKSHYCEKDGEI